MGFYRQFHTQFWKDEYILDLETEGKLLFIYLFSNETTSLSGLYKLPLKVVEFETGLDIKTIKEHLEQFEVAGKIWHRDGLFFVKTLRKYNKGGATVEKSIRNDLENLDDCELKRLYYSIYYPDETYPHDRVSIGYGKGMDTHSLNDINDIKDSNDKVDDDPQPFPQVLTAIQATDIFAEITGMVTIPNGKDKSSADALEQLYDLRKPYTRREDMVSDGKAYYIVWTDRGYRKTNTGWLDWWVACEIPPLKVKAPRGKGWSEA